MAKTAPSNRIGLALSGGSALGIAHVGVIRALAERGVPIDCIAGTSSGAVVAACHAFGVPMEKLAETARSLNWLSMSRISFSGLGVFSHAALIAFLERFLKDAKIEDAAIPLAIVATDLESGRRTVFTKGPLMEALTASVSIPGLFVPVKIGDRLFVDGALTDNLPLDALKELGATIRIGVDVNRWLSRRHPQHALDVVMRSIEIATTYHRPPAEDELIVEPHLEAFTPSDFSKTEGIIDEGYRAAVVAMDDIRSLLSRHRVARRHAAAGIGGWWEGIKSWFRK